MRYRSLRLRYWFVFALIIGLGMLSAALGMSADNEKGKSMERGSEAAGELSLPEAAKIALRNFHIVKAELETEHERLIWSFEIALAKAKEIIEVQVDAKNGRVVSIEIERPKDKQRAETEGDNQGESRAKAETAKDLSVSSLPKAARAMLENLTAGGRVDGVEKEIEHGKTVFDVEATVGDKHVEYTIAEDGTVLGNEVGIELKELPAAVREAGEKFFGNRRGMESGARG